MKKYAVALIDPPWHYFASSSKQSRRATETHYPTLSIASIRALPVGELADTDCALFLWITAPMLPELPGILEAWSFSYKTVAFVWIKLNRKTPSLFWGMGNWTRANAEYCVLAVKGHPKRVSAAVHQVIVSPVEEHSKKPDEVRDRIVHLMGDVPRVELFARQRTPDWDAWGNEVESDIQLPGWKGEAFCATSPSTKT
ncbi:MAG: MT-A70 family methyltransferase [Ethanoligenens sp.]